MRKWVRETYGDGRFVDYKEYSILPDGSVLVESWTRDEDWDSYGAKDENYSGKIIPLSECKLDIREKFLNCKPISIREFVD
jgi:hypothetical protein